MAVFFPKMRPPTQSGRISQYFGENSAIYKAFGNRIGVPLEFHNGIDFPAMKRAPILAPIDGVIRKTGYDPTGYGYYIEITIFDDAGEEWGWVLLAHADEAFKKHIGAIVRQGEEIGKVGSTGNSTGYHVHMELAINDFYRAAYNSGSLGRVNPLPFLQRPIKGSGIGSHWQTSINWHVPLSGRHPVVKIMSGWDDVAAIIDFLEQSPNTFVILRDHANVSVDYDAVKADPHGSGIRHAKNYLDKLEGIPHHLRQWVILQSLNEPPWWEKGWPAVIDTYNASGAKYTLLHGRGIHWGGDEKSTGWGGEEQDNAPAMRLWFVISGAVLTRHEYWKDYPGGPRNAKWWTWHCGRILRNDWPIMTAITETGADYPPGHKAWKDMYSNDAKAFMDDLIAYDAQMRANDTRYIGCTPFTDTPEATWLNFDTGPIRGYIALYNSQKDLPRAVSRSLLPKEVTMQPITPPRQGKTTANLRLRAAPTTAANILAVVPKNNPVTINGKNEGGDWYHVDTDFGPGWMARKYIELTEEPEREDIGLLLAHIAEDVDAIRTDVAIIKSAIGAEDGEETPPAAPSDGPKIYDFDGNEVGWEWIKETWGPGIEWQQPPDLKKGEKYWALVHLKASKGIASFNARCLDENGRPSQNNVAWWWRDAATYTGGCSSQWHPRYHAQKTDKNGYTGFGAGSDAWKHPDEPGPYDAWICSSLKSDIIKGLGFKPGTDHWWFSHAVWQIRVAE